MRILGRISTPTTFAGGKAQTRLLKCVFSYMQRFPPIIKRENLALKKAFSPTATGIESGLHKTPLT